MQPVHVDVQILSRFFQMTDDFGPKYSTIGLEHTIFDLDS